MTKSRTIKCTSCRKRVDPVVWSCCQARGHCYHCGAELSLVTLRALREATTT